MALVPRKGPRRPTYSYDRDTTERELRNLHKKPPPSENPKVVEKEMLFSYSGHPLSGEESPGFVMFHPEATITKIVMRANVAPTTTTTFLLKVNGATAYTINWPVGDFLVVEEALNIDLAEYDATTVVFSVLADTLSAVAVHVFYQVIQPGT